MFIGAIVMTHWVCFFGSIKLANASIALITFATTALFTAIVEPWITNRKVKVYEITMGLFIIPGMVLIVQSVPSSTWPGILVGLIAAFLAAVFVTLNKQLVEEHSEQTITFVELGSGCILLTVGLFISISFQKFSIHDFLPIGSDWIFLFCLALLCTVIAYLLFLRALRQISALPVKSYHQS